MARCKECEGRPFCVHKKGRPKTPKAEPVTHRMGKLLHDWGPWTRCPAVETPEEERARRGPAPQGETVAKMCARCGRIRVRRGR